MYIDQILLGLGGIGLIGSGLAIGKLVASRNSHKLNKAILAEEESEKIRTVIDAISSMATVVEDEEGSVGSEWTVVDTTEQVRTVMDQADCSSSQEPNKHTFDYLNQNVFKDRYAIQKEIKGGGMSKVYIATSKLLENEWIIKYVDKEHATLLREEDILKKLNHISLPKIIDIFYHETGTYLVQSYIEGITLEGVISSKIKLSQLQIIEWAEQLAQVLQYLHGLKPNPIIHRDLKPGNVMVTHHNKLVLIDFGIAKENAIGAKDIQAATKYYAAPEQYKGATDERSDIYSLGVILFELATRIKPTQANLHLLDRYVSKELKQLILRCLQEKPEHRYQTIGEVIEALEKISQMRVKMAQGVIRRKFWLITSIGVFFTSGGSALAGGYIMNQHNLSVVALDPNVLKISEQQSRELLISQVFATGQVKDLKPSEIEWLHPDNAIVKIEGDTVVGMNEGTFELVGKYRNKVITTQIQVVKPIEGTVEVSLKYDKAYEIETAYGDEERAHQDGALDEASFVSPESITQTEDGTYYVVDSGVLRKITSESVETLTIAPSYLTPHLVRSHGNDVYVLTNAWEDETGQMLYGMIKLHEVGAEGIYLADAYYTDILDFTFDDEGDMFFIERSVLGGYVTIKKIDFATGELTHVAEVSEDTVALAINDTGAIYTVSNEQGIIEHINKETGESTYIAGIKGQRHFIDGQAAQFYNPQKLVASGDDLYVLDFNVIRKVTLAQGVATDVETIVGEVSTADNVRTYNGQASDTILEKTPLREFVVNKEGLYITDPSKSVIRKVSNPYARDKDNRE